MKNKLSFFLVIAMSGSSLAEEAKQVVASYSCGIPGVVSVYAKELQDGTFTVDTDQPLDNGRSEVVGPIFTVQSAQRQGTSVELKGRRSSYFSGREVASNFTLTIQPEVDAGSRYTLTNVRTGEVVDGWDLAVTCKRQL